jgi:hypothetical protein
VGIRCPGLQHPFIKHIEKPLLWRDFPDVDYIVDILDVDKDTWRWTIRSKENRECKIEWDETTRMWKEVASFPSRLSESELRAHYLDTPPNAKHERPHD